ncbi:hypothetical protein [Micromonospora sp. DT31]|uniref:hypothetical protein n=1 Tax=Micromonospora sp. DT31 TaxID=3393434 RepID=UPI003CF0ED50
MDGGPQFPQVPAQPEGQRPQPAKRSGRKVLLAVIGALLACGGLCGVGQLITNVINQDDLEGRGSPVPSPTVPESPKPTWPKPNLLYGRPDPSIRYTLEQNVLNSAGVLKPMTSRCDNKGFTGEHGATFDCTVTYAGLDVVFTVVAKPSGSYTFEWTASAKQTVVTREGLLAHFHRRYQGDWSDRRCDEFPEVALVPADKPLPQVCYGKIEGRIKTSTIRITPQDDAPAHLETEHQDEGLQ